MSLAPKITTNIASGPDSGQMRVDAYTRTRLKIRLRDGQWNLEINRKPVMRSNNHHWLRRLAVEVRRAMVIGAPTR